MYSGDKLSREKLEDIGISRYVQFKELNNSQADFLDKFFRHSIPRTILQPRVKATSEHIYFALGQSELLSLISP